MIDSISAFIRTQREASGLTQRELAVKAGLNINTIGRIERKRIAPTLPTLSKIAKALDIDLSKLLNRC